MPPRTLYHIPKHPKKQNGGGCGSSRIELDQSNVVQFYQEALERARERRLQHISQIDWEHYLDNIVGNTNFKIDCDETMMNYTFEILTYEDYVKKNENEAKQNMHAFPNDDVLKIEKKSDINITHYLDFRFVVKCLISQYIKNQAITMFQHPITLTSDITWQDLSKILYLFVENGSGFEEEASPSQSPGAQDAGKLNLKKTSQKITIQGKSRVVYVTPRNKQYVRINGRYTAVRDLRAVSKK